MARRLDRRDGYLDAALASLPTTPNDTARRPASCSSAPTSERIADRFDLIVSNPPYVPSNARDGLPPDVRDYEPAVALFGGNDGFVVIERLLDQAADALRPGGHLVMEFGAGLDDRVSEVVSRRPRLRLEAIHEDIQRIPRVASIART